jgi:hypothetical protein
MGPQIAGTRHRLQGFDGFVFVEARSCADFEQLATELGLTYEAAGSFSTLPTRGAKLGVREASFGDWEKALRTRSFKPFEAVLQFYRVAPAEP